MPLVSAIVPSYNYARFVVRAVESCLAQTFQDLEVVVTDDASTDESPRILRERFGNDPRVRLELHAQNAGVSGNFNRGLRAARGELVAFCCADDEWLPEHVATLLPAIRSSEKVAVAYARVKQISLEGAQVPAAEEIYFDSCPDPEFFDRLVSGPNYVPFIATLFKREEALRVGGFLESVKILQDWGLWLALGARHEARFVDHEVAIVRWHGENASARGSKTSEQRKRDAVTVLEKLLASEGEALRARGLERVARRRLASQLSRLARRTSSKAEALACSRRAVALDPWSAGPYLSLLRSLVSRHD